MSSPSVSAPTMAIESLEDTAVFATIHYGEGQSKIVNLDSSLRHITDFLASILQVAPSSICQIDLATDRGKLLDLPGMLSEKGIALLKSRTSYVPVLILDVPKDREDQHSAFLESNQEVSSRSSSARSAKKSARRPPSSVSDDKDDLKTHFQIGLSHTTLAAKFPAFELSRGGTRVKRSLIVKWEDEFPPSK